jgi:hypothetical protein
VTAPERIAHFTALAKSAADASHYAEGLVAFKPARKHEAILRLLAQNEGTVTSYSAAEKQVELEEEYASYLWMLINAQREAAYLLAKARAAELTAALAVKHSLEVEA